MLISYGADFWYYFCSTLTAELDAAFRFLFLGMHSSKRSCVVILTASSSVSLERVEHGQAFGKQEIA
jgi:hypothetical protein